MPSSRTYRLILQWQDRRWGPQLHKTAEQGSSIRRAINKALLSFFSDKNRRKERGDAHVALTLSVCRMKPSGIHRAKRS
jgi:hypothetical protein